MIVCVPASVTHRKDRNKAQRENRPQTMQGRKEEEEMRRQGKEQGRAKGLLVCI